MGQNNGVVGAMIEVLFAVDYLICLASWNIFRALSPITYVFLPRHQYTIPISRIRITAKITPAT